jgi:hypothetical protein
MPLTLKAINAELAKRGHHVRLEKGSDYFYFWTGDAADWLDRTVLDDISRRCRGNRGVEQAVHLRRSLQRWGRVQNLDQPGEVRFR